MKNLATLILALLTALAAPAAAVPGSGPSGQTLRVADSLYAAKDYTQAILHYRKATEETAPCAALYFNLGNAAMQANRYGDAMVAYQRAAALDPANARIRNNIAYLQQKVDDRNTAALGSRRGDLRHAEPSGLDALWNSITAHHSAALWGWLGFSCFLLLLADLLCYILSPSVLARKTGFFASLVLLAATVLFGIFTAGARSHWQQRRECVVTAYSAQLLPKPDKDAKAEVPPLAAGTLLTLPENDTPAPDGWVYVRLNPATAGWLPISDLTML